MNLNNIGLMPTDDADILAARMRHQRDRRLAGSDWAMASDAPTNKEAWAAYRQALRDLPANWVPAETVEFPLAPGEVAPEPEPVTPADPEPEPEVAPDTP